MTHGIGTVRTMLASSRQMCSVREIFRIGVSLGALGTLILRTLGIAA